MSDLVRQVITESLSDRVGDAPATLAKIAPDDLTASDLAALRLAVQQPGHGLMYYQGLLNVWRRWGRAELKPNVVSRRVLLLSDFTAESIAPFVELFSAAYGVDARVDLPPFDSVEQLALARDGAIGSGTTVVLLLSPHWMERYLGAGPLVRESDLDRLKQMYATIVTSLTERGPAAILLCTFFGGPFAHPAGLCRHNKCLGWTRVLQRLNTWLADEIGAAHRIVDLGDAIALAGGQAALGQTNFFRARMAFEPNGTFAVAREIAAGLAHLCGKTHRALVTDWDDTLWGGLVAEVGSLGVACGIDSPEGLGYYRLQQYLQGLPQLGVLLAAVSRNDPETASIFDENPSLCLKRDDFVAMEVGFRPKSQSIREIASQLGFGPEFMVFVDDSVFELAESLLTNPYLDVVRAGPAPEATLRRLIASRFFHTPVLSSADVDRHEASQRLRQQREHMAHYHSLDDFLRDITIEIVVHQFDESNQERVVQLLQKTNQFNLTTRRHTQQDLRELERQGAGVGVFSYSDCFGSQGIVSVVILVPSDELVEIDTWLMSCRVLNRTVERAVFEWIVGQTGDRALRGVYVPTQKNRLVADLFSQLGFDRGCPDLVGDAEYWSFVPRPDRPLPEHHATLRVLQSSLR